MTAKIWKVSEAISNLFNFDELGDFKNETLIQRPKEDTEGVVIHTLKTGVVDTIYGNIINAGHMVIDYVYAICKGGGTVAQIFARETRYTIKDGTTVGSMYGNTHVLESDGEVSGTATNVILENLSDHSSSTWFTNILSQYLDPRHLLKTRGGILGCSSGIGTTTYTAKDQDSGGIHTVVSGSGCTVTIPASSAEGFNACYVHGDTNPLHKVIITVPSPGVLIGTTQTTAKGEVLRVRYLSAGYFLGTLEK
jgi:hypothetical protein